MAPTLDPDRVPERAVRRPTHRIPARPEAFTEGIPKHATHPSEWDGRTFHLGLLIGVLIAAAIIGTLVVLASGGRGWAPVVPLVLSAPLVVLTISRYQRRVRALQAATTSTAPSRVRVLIRGEEQKEEEEEEEGTAAEVIARPVSRPATSGHGTDPTGPGDQGWATAADRFARVRAEYAAFETDPLQVLRLPALVDASVPSTARFIDAFADAQSLATDRYPGVDHARRFAAAADHAERTWTAARDAAERIRFSGLTPTERGTIERVVKLLTTARDSDNEPERLAAYARARTELDRLDRTGVVHVPRNTRAALDAVARGQLPG
ncbi:hypothetical protein [Pseudonocardia humida]|uniref:DUF2786 domain-containing protein n=1 Tax=Pseudonocardia humida TaxID=2800819 RepID=A0ABT1A6X0_9PSEU|nr:hypothetical protein [Pseudonocardia humida]MCO1658474.1 hypothetical protein [Pseudonocardia humida]